MQPGTMKLVPTGALSLHPFLEQVQSGKDEATSRRIRESVCDLGLAGAIIASKGRVLDGWDRVSGAIAAGLEEVWVSEVDEADAASFVVNLLTARGHYSKTWLCYILFPLMETALAEARRRVVNRLRTDASACKSSAPSALPVGRLEDHATNCGFGRRLFYGVQAIRKHLSEHSEWRAIYEPQMARGEVCYKQVLVALSGKAAGAEGKTIPKGDAAQLMLQLGDSAIVRFARGEIPTEKERAAIVEKWCGEVAPAMPKWIALPLAKRLAELNRHA